MTLPAALFGTAVRVLRTAAGRRALHLALLVGGLFMAGFLCGEKAHAAEGTPVAPARPVSSVAGHADPVRTAGTAGTVRTVTERVVTPVREVVQRASGSLEEARAEVPALPAVPSAPAPPSMPSVPAPPSVPSVPLPELPGVSEQLPVPPPPAPSTPEPRPRRQDGTAPAAGGTDDRARTEARTAVSAPPSATAYGPGRAIPVASRAPVHPNAHHTTAPFDAPEQPAPTGDPDSVLGKQAADGTASRHGDAHAVTTDGRAPLRLLPGTAARVDAPGTRERHRDIPVFPG
ncbi:hypothetical protein [Streptomyces sp. NPDC048521]|uniref:hypothetical protein n=1 Tax=Streptomyces sp. NPDC048521 TaxID=3365566 RepID=UPI00371C1EFA